MTAITDLNQIVMLSGICTLTDLVCLCLHYFNELSESKWFVMHCFVGFVFVAEAKQSVFTN